MSMILCQFTDYNSNQNNLDIPMPQANPRFPTETENVHALSSATVTTSIPGLLVSYFRFVQYLRTMEINKDMLSSKD